MPKGSGDSPALTPYLGMLRRVRKGLEAERLWRLRTSRSNLDSWLRSEKGSKPKGCGDVSHAVPLWGATLVRKGLEAERLWRQLRGVDEIIILTIGPKRARSRKALATFNDVHHIHPEEWSEKGSMPKGSGDLPKVLVQTELRLRGPKRARCRKALATLRFKKRFRPTGDIVRKGLDAERLWRQARPDLLRWHFRESEKGSMPKGSGDTAASSLISGRR